MESLKQKLYRSNSNAKDSIHFSPGTHAKIGPVFPYQPYENYKYVYKTDFPHLEDPDFSQDPEDPLPSVPIVYADKKLKATAEQDFKYNFGVKGVKHFPHVEIEVSISRLITIKNSLHFHSNLAKHFKYLRTLTVYLDEYGRDADITWLCNNVLKFLSNLRELKIVPKL